MTRSSVNPPEKPRQEVTTVVTPSGVADEKTASSIQVVLDKSGFSPKEIKAKVGTKVIWVNQSGAVATVNSAVHPTHRDYPPLNLGSLADGELVEIIFNEPGTYQYHNHLNTSQAGVVIVE